MEISIDNGVFFRRLITSIKELTNMSNIKFDANGMTINTIDHAHICLIDVFLSRPFFEGYNLNGSLTIGVNFEILSDILKLSKRENIKLLYTQQSDHLLVDISDTKIIKFDMALVNIDQETNQMPALTYDYIVYMETQEFHKCVKDLSTFGDRCTIAVETNKISFIVTGDSGTGEISVTEKITIDKLGDIPSIKLTFNSKYLLLFSKAALSDQIILKFSNVSPFCCEYEHTHGHINFFLANLSD